LFTQSITVRLPANSRWEKVVVNDLTGKTVFEQTLQGSETTLNLPANLAEGVYFIGLQNGTKRSPLKELVKVR